MTESINPVSFMSKSTERYKKACAILSGLHYTPIWEQEIETGLLSLWGHSSTLVMVQQVSDGVELYSNHSGRTFAEVESWAAGLRK